MDGVWVKGEIIPDGIEISWQARTKVSGDNLYIFDINGSVEKMMPRDRAVYPPPMRSAGLIEIGDDFVGFCGAALFEDSVAAVMRHAVHMIAMGYGESPEEVVSWFQSVRDMDFIVGTSYKFIEEFEPFEDFSGLTCSVDEKEDREVVAVVSVRGEQIEVPLEGDAAMVAFLMSTVPV